ncbi:MAG: glycerophosphodiester phosphodiesterase family protein [Pirellulaceae bacterium]|nr:glycerophosphodiester phosphodiesterase family protein [Pirellulaceae bacterium]
MRPLQPFWTLLFVSVCSLAFADDSIRMIAHRGGVVTDSIIENNLAAIEAAVQRGYWMVEVDVRKSKDGVAVVHHDADFKRYYGDPRQVADLTWDQISKLRATPGNERPLTLAEYLQACDGRLRIMLDVKGGDLPESFVEAIEQSLREHQQLQTTYVIGASEVKQRLTGKAIVSMKYDQIVAAKNRGEDVSSRYFLFPRGMRFKAPEVQQGLELGVPVVPSINIFHYLGINHKQRAKQDIERLRNAGVTEFQIDSVYDQWLIDQP